MKNWKNGVSFQLAFLFLLLFFTLQTGATDFCNDWQWVNPLPTGENLNKVIYANDKLWVVGDCGTIMCSTDGMQWIKQISGIKENLNSIAFNGLFFIAVGEYSTILKSNDGEAWEVIPFSQHLSFNDILWVNDKFILTSDNGIYTSEDGEEWTLRYQLELDFSLFGITSTGNKIITTKYGCVYDQSGKGILESIVMVSEDGILWEEKGAVEDRILYKICTNGTAFIAGSSLIDYWNGGRLLLSKDLTNWEEIYSTKDVYSFADVIWDGSYFYAVGSKQYYSDNYYQNASIFRSSDGKLWTKVSRQERPTLNSLTIWTNGFVAVGGNGLILKSANGIEWDESITPIWANFLGITYGNGIFVASGYDIVISENVIFTSVDGVRWEKITFSPQYAINKIIWTGSRFIGVGYEGIIITSSSGLDWNQTFLTPNTDINDCSFNDLIFTGTKYIAVGTALVGDGWNHCGIIATSNDGEIWEVKTFKNIYSFYSIAYNGKQVAVTGEKQNGSLTIKVCTDGKKWKKAILPDNHFYPWYAHFLAYGNGKFITDPGTGSFLTSSNGLKWILSPKPEEMMYAPINAMLWDGSIFQGIYKSDYQESSYMRSSDGMNWQLCPKIANKELYSIAIDGQKVILVGNGGSILKIN